jgi:hypothetical protein
MKEDRFSLPFTSFGREQCISPMKSFCLKQYSYVEARTNFDKGCHGFRSNRGRDMRTQLGFRDFSSLFLVKENRGQLGNSACCISFIKVSLTSRVFAMDERSESGMQC